MPLYSVFTNEYDADIVQLLKRRLVKQRSDEAVKLSQALTCCEGNERRCAGMNIETQSELAACCMALSELICFDMRYFEMAEMVERLPVDAERKRSILKGAIEYSRYCIDPAWLCTALEDYFSENRRMNIEGFIRFRLKDRLAVWRAAVDSATEDELVGTDRSELFDLFGVLTAFDGERGAVTVVLNPDASCTIMNDFVDKSTAGSRRMRIDCAPGNADGALGMLRALKPARIALIDLSFGECEELKRRIFELFTVQ